MNMYTKQSKCNFIKVVPLSLETIRWNGPHELYSITLAEYCLCRWSLFIIDDPSFNGKIIMCAGLLGGIKGNK